MSMDVPTWEVIRISLKHILSRYDLEFSNIGLAKRIDYKDFEQIFYLLFFIIDPSDTKRKFRSIYPARNSDEENQFYKTSLDMINTKQMYPYRASLAQLKMLGGQPFRKLLGSLIEKAAECEIQCISKKYPKFDMSIETISESNIKRLEKLQRDIEDELPKLRDTISRYGSLQETLNNITLETNETLEMINVTAFRDLNDSIDIKNIFKSLLARLEKSSLRRTETARKINSIPINAEDLLESVNSLQISTKHPPRRTSEYIKEARRALSPDCNEAAAKPELRNKISELLMNYDDGVESLVKIWEDEQERFEAALAEIPEMQRRYEFFENLIPMISFSPISFDMEGEK